MENKTDEQQANQVKNPTNPINLPETSSTISPNIQSSGFVTGSQIQLEELSVRSMRTKKYILLGIVLFVALLVVSSILVFSAKKDTKEGNNTPAVANNTPSAYIKPSSTTSTQQPVPPKYGDVVYTSGEGRIYKIKYLTGVRILKHCDLGVNKNNCMPPVPNTRYLAASSSGKETLLLSLQKDTGKIVGSTCKTVAFSVTLNNTATDVCTEGLGGRVLYYSFKFTIQGERQLGTFQMDNQDGVAFFDASVYESDIKEIIPTIQATQ